MDVPAITERLGRLVPWRRPDNGDRLSARAPDDPPLRAELFSADQLERHALALAQTHEIARGRGTDKLIPRLNENERILVNTYDLVTAAVAKDRRIAPAAEWLLDNFYLIEEQIRTARRHLPRSYSRELPRLSNGPTANYPRAYGLAFELIAHVDGLVDATGLNTFIAAYQTIAPLTLGELWAVPIMLRLALIENLRRVASRVAAGRRDRDLADDWAERMLHVVEKNPTDLILVLADMAREDPPLSGAFIAELTRHLQGQSPYFAFANSWLEHRLAEQGMTIEQLVTIEAQAQAADQVSIGNSISSLRFLSSTDWRKFVESHSVVEAALQRDPAGVYAEMDFGTRDLYRHALEQIARRSRLPEGEIAHKAVQLAANETVCDTDHRAGHVGYYLIGQGRSALERVVRMRRTLPVIVAKIGRRFPLAIYVTSILLLTCASTIGFLEWCGFRGARAGWLAVLAAPAVLFALHIAIGLVNWLATLIVKPRPLPRMSFRHGIPAEHRTIVVVPTMLTSPATVERLVDGLEVKYLANRDKHLHFALLTDLPDADQESTPGDDDLVNLARSGIEALNEKYADQRDDIFFLLHRRRQWNDCEGRWMGYERKRGKLADLNALLRTGPNRFAEIVGRIGVLPEVKYVITLDTDTELPRDSARGMVGAMAHPLNRPVFDAERRRVVDGYAILQPRISVSLPAALESWYVRLLGGDSGIDPYTRAVSDVYQDLFGEGSFIGKGIYDVDAFVRSCDVFPPNRILSHDLIESAYARSALLSDVELYEDYPSRYSADVSRRHRWIRGDWQIAHWLMPWVPGPEGQRTDNPIAALAWWKILDNLRRSLLSPLMLLALLVSWMFMPAPLAVATTVFILAALATAPVTAVLTDLMHRPANLPLRLHLRNVLSTLGRNAAQFLLSVSLLAHDACVSVDAILRTLTRLCWTKRNLLEWKTARESQDEAHTDLRGFVQLMWVAALTGAGTLLVLALVRRDALALAAPLAGLWGLSPVLAWWLSQPLIARPPRLSPQQHLFLGKLARRTWRFFEVFVTQQENWLPPDNMQEVPELRVAPRTSPTNIGASLLANLSAYDFGYCSGARLLDRTRKTLGTMARLEQYRGHFYNWYDTRSLHPLPPSYISTVDSGNLAGHLLVLRCGLLELIDSPVQPPRILAGIAETLRVLLDEAAGQLPQDLHHKAQRHLAELEKPPHSIRPVSLVIDRLVELAGEIKTAAGNSRWSDWATAFEHDCIDHRDDLTRLAEWAGIPAAPESLVLQSPSALSALRELLDDGLTLRQTAELRDTALQVIDASIAQASPDAGDWLRRFRRAVVESSQRAAERISSLRRAAEECHELSEMDFTFLFDESRDLLSIGYSVSNHRLDVSYYDLLASEARLASYVAIAQGQLGQQHWFALGRLLTTTRGAPALLSWSGSMFEYLMPLLVMPSYQNTLLDQTCKAAVRRQIRYGRQQGVPWGISESGYNIVDLHMNYQYRAFGVPGLGLKRGLAEDLVVAPYASALALMVAPEAACRNLERLTAEGLSGAYGLYEAVDYTPARLPPGVDSVVIRQFMAHHQGMSMLALAHLLLNRPMQRRFDADPLLRAADSLLKERVPKATEPVFPHAAEAAATRISTAEEEGATRVIADPNSAVPEVHLLSNGRYHVMITSAGGGYSRWRELAVTRWREDPTRDHYGAFCYLRDVESGAFWSTTWQPTVRPTRFYEAIFTQGRAEFRRRDEGIEAYTEISISPEDDVEVRRISLTNYTHLPRTIEVTSYAEIVLAAQPQDLSHPAFSNLFVQTELVRHRQAIFATRRPRSAQERPPWMAHLMVVHGTTQGEPSFETDRMKFIGRGRDVSSPAAMESPAALSDSEGPVLDPIAAIRRVLVIQPNETVRVDVLIGVAETREGITAITDKYHDPRLADRVFEMAWTHSHVLLRQLNASEADAQTYGRLAGSVVYPSSLRRAKPSVLARNRRGQSGLWGYGISGDLPIVLLRIRDRAHLDLVRQAVHAHAYWRTKGLIVDLAIWNEDDSVYRQNLQEAIMDLIAASPGAALVDKPGGIFVRRGEQMSDEDRVLLQTVARVILLDDAGTLAEQAERRGRGDVPVPPFKPLRRRPEPLTAAEVPQRDLAFFNGLGGFSRDGKEYVTILAPGQMTPAPWINVIANSQLGTVVSEGGGSYTWYENCHEFRLTPWHNDPVSDSSGEAIYIRDEESGRFWSPTPLPARGSMPYVSRHGFGYSVFEYSEDGITTEMHVYVATDAPVKFARLRITNRSGRSRQLSVTGYWELVLSEHRGKSAMHVVTESDPSSGAIFARNAYNAEFPNRVVFVDSSESVRTISGDRTEFLGRNGSPANPAAMRRTRLSGRVGAGLDPCAAIRAPVALESGQTRDIVFMLGAAGGDEQARDLVRRFRGTARAQQVLDAVWQYWSRALGAVHVETPDPSVNFLVNGWLLYQTLACRMWARTGFYQSGGAFGFRDQLQDSMALVHAEPLLLREHLLRAAGRQFREGDVQHWWHPPIGRGVRTHISDDYLWLPYAACRYVKATGDTGVLEERVPFLTGRPVRPEEDSYYDLPHVSDETEPLYEHCVRAITNGLRFGSHGLPLIGTGDWNDGMNIVGHQGKGESVWLAFFLHDVLMQFAEVARKRSDDAQVERCTREAAKLRDNIETGAWDGDWYRRAYFDDGTPLGSASNPECSIDALPQAWAILSGAASPERSALAMKNALARLARPDKRLIQLLDPPFDKSDLDPGYIKGYVPGVRENGGQYTHAAIWTVMAVAAMGDAKRAWELFGLINPLTHADTAEAMATYRVEPYVVAADVYAVPPHVGRGGWTWYTGSAGWMYRLLTESLLGIRLEVDKLRFSPCLPAEWKSFKVHYRYRETFYHVTVRSVGRGLSVKRVVVDGVEQADKSVPLVADRVDHNVDVELG